MHSFYHSTMHNNVNWQSACHHKNITGLLRWWLWFSTKVDEAVSQLVTHLLNQAIKQSTHLISTFPSLHLGEKCTLNYTIFSKTSHWLSTAHCLTVTYLKVRLDSVTGRYVSWEYMFASSGAWTQTVIGLILQHDEEHFERGIKTLNVGRHTLRSVHCLEGYPGEYFSLLNL